MTKAIAKSSECSDFSGQRSRSSHEAHVASADGSVLANAPHLTKKPRSAETKECTPQLPKNCKYMINSISPDASISWQGPDSKHFVTAEYAIVLQ